MNDLVHVQGGSSLTAVEVRGQVQLIQEVMREVMKPEVHYGTIPGTPKPTLYKAGAEKLCTTFRLGPEYDIADKERDGSHLSITARCTLFHIPTGQRVGSALGSCSTHEAKYAYRNAGRSCPTCGVESIGKSKPEYGGGWYCNKARGGCGAKFKADDPAITSQQPGQVDNPDKADQYNTVLKMACKRALLAAVLNATGASDIFSQDLLPDPEDRLGDDEPPPPKRAPAAKAQTGAVNAGQVRVLRGKMTSLGVTDEQLCARFGIAAVEDLPASEINTALKFADEGAADAPAYD